ncbi:amidohydrolase family protein [Tropicibacter sp. Alg240-R139]|uniref:amidohydrolase family protein n=1 Tax=Tropicibacter sp. Alg240-R139 TaxID=2305991 RepID=UPI0013DECDAB|nr:amidohydrolase family protein [Tropicibacter sp. Alg240-R139]
MTPARHTFLSAATVIGVGLFTASGAIAQDYDLVILNGRVMDPETRYDAIANVGVKDGQIAAITKDDLSGTKTIDASGHLVTAGFIDQHFHWTRPVGYKLALRDGVTTAMDLEAGADGRFINEWYEMHAGRSQVNYGTASSHEFARAAVLDGHSGGFDAPGAVLSARGGKNWADGVVDLETGNEALGIIDQGLRLGAVGVASTVGYFPGATAREMFEVQRLGGSYDRATFVHTRYTPGTSTTTVNGIQEVLANAAALDVPLSVNHFNNDGWRQVQELIIGLQNQGYNIWGEYYPYAAGSTTINAAFVAPEVWIDELGNSYEETLQDPETGEFYHRARYEKDVVEDPTKQIILYKMPVEDIPAWVALPGVVMASDAMMVPGGWDQLPWDIAYEDIPNAHPRTAGSHGKSLRLAREHDIPLMHVLATFSYNVAKHLGDTGLKSMQIRGRMQEGMAADIVVLDPRNVIDNSDYYVGTLPTTGIPYVVVNGAVVVEDSKVRADVFPGEAIRFPVQEEGRFVPLDESVWARDNLNMPEASHEMFEDITAD